MAQSFKASSLKGGYGRNAGRRWRAGDVAELRQLINRGLPLRTISLKLGRPDSAIRAKAGALGLHLSEEAGRPAGDRRRAVSRPVSPGGLRDRREPASARPRQLELFG